MNDVQKIVLIALVGVALIYVPASAWGQVRVSPGPPPPPPVTIFPYPTPIPPQLDLKLDNPVQLPQSVTPDFRPTLPSLTTPNVETPPLQPSPVAVPAQPGH